MSLGRCVAEDRCVRWEWHSAEMAVDPTMSIKPRFVPYWGWLWLHRGCQRRKIRCLEGKRPGPTGRIWTLSLCGEQEYWKRGRTLLQKRSSTWLLWSGQGDFSLESCYLIAHSNSNKTYALVNNSTAKKVLIFGSKSILAASLSSRNSSADDMLHSFIIFWCFFALCINHMIGSQIAEIAARYGTA